MQVRWFGQSAFALNGGEITVAIDPFADMSGLAGRGIQFDYPRSPACRRSCCS